MSRNEASAPLVTYRCPSCRRLMRGRVGRAGERCPLCESDRVVLLPSGPTLTQLREHEEAIVA